MKLNIVILKRLAKNLSLASLSWRSGRMRVFNSDIRQRFLVVLLLGMTITASPTSAADSTPSADIKSKLEEFKKEIASKAAKLKQEVNRKLKDKAYVGQVKSKSNSSLTLAARLGSKIVSLNQDTVFESNVKGKKFSAKILTEEDYVVSLGDIDETGILIAKKVILLDPKPYIQNPKSYLWGQIIAISDKLITLKDKGAKNVAVSLNNQSEIKLNNFVILTGTKNKNDIFEAGFVYVFPQAGIIKPKKTRLPDGQVATSSAKPATPSAKPRMSF